MKIYVSKRIPFGNEVINSFRGVLNSDVDKVDQEKVRYALANILYENSKLLLGEQFLSSPNPEIQHFENEDELVTDWDHYSVTKVDDYNFVVEYDYKRKDQKFDVHMFLEGDQ